MPIVKPEIQKILRASGLDSTKEQSDESSISEKLEAAGLSDERLAELLTDIASGSANEGIRLRAIETGLKVRGALKESAPAAPSFTIVIQSANPSSPQHEVNPIMFPRQSMVNKNIVNDKVS